MRNDWLLVFACAGSVLACGGGEERPEAIDVTQDTTSSSTGGSGEGGADGGPSSGSSTSGGTGLALNPEEMYAVGWLDISTGRPALVQLSMPSLYAVGFSILVDEGRPFINAGELFYFTEFEEGLRRYVPEFYTDRDPVDIEYPDDPEDNDPMVDTAACHPDSGVGPTEALSSPDGVLIYSCEGDRWFVLGEDSTEPIFTGRLVSLGYDMLALTEDMELLQLPDGEPQPTSASVNPLTVRATRSGFLVANLYELWEITAAGSAEQLGEYPNIDDHIDGYTMSPALDREGAIYLNGSGQVLRRTIDGVAEIVYDERDHFVQLPATSHVFSGP